MAIIGFITLALLMSIVTFITVAGIWLVQTGFDNKRSLFYIIPFFILDGFLWYVLIINAPFAIRLV